MKLTRYIVSIFALLFATSALACSCKENSEEELFRQAEYIAHIRVTGTTLRPIKDLSKESYYDEVKEDTPEYIRISFDEVEVFKGPNNRPENLREFPFGPGNCMLGLQTGIEYVVYQTKASTSFVTFCSGSFGFFNREGTEVVPKLEKLRKWAKSAP